MKLLGDGLLGDLRVRTAGPASATLTARLTELGASVTDAPPAGPEESVHQALLVDARGWFGEGGEPALRATLDEVWQAIGPVAAAELIPSGRGGRIILIAPPPRAPLAAAARDALENLARTLSTEWARFAITTVAVAPAAAAAEPDLAELIAYLLSDAGGYFSGCRLDFG